MSILSYLQATPAAFIFCFALLGLVIGSFLNVVILRLPRMMERDWRCQCRELLELDADPADATPLSLASPASSCPHCQHAIRWYENIPVLSYLWLRGRCAGCRQRIALRYPVVELAAGLLAAISAWHFGFGMAALLAAILSWALLTLSVIDLDTQYLPDDITLPMLWLGLAANLFGVFTSLHAAVLGAICGYGILWLIYQAFRLLTGKEGMGYGDFKLLGMLGAWLGWDALPLIVVLASLVGAIVGVALIVFGGHDRRVPIPFGPYLAAAGWITLIAGPAISQAYLAWALAG
ncbi:leader peptidase (prepilin peptidase)/N-methyltransferase [Methylohalomonas lacus]|uniref:Prepilin leader peptidase/N-methyltransferase n=1 Tax=Methylohalomonas lacus TaxID=398773 RepID=A0AAE3HNP7_9GAMM|nr:A24 family peptidase [Methylohalomonas lacus]MCS3903868.1 leader peptidase (prepilin peptidase)/N-methyltransferase [Methylohalomonas lacus]